MTVSAGVVNGTRLERIDATEYKTNGDIDGGRIKGVRERQKLLMAEIQLETER